MPDSPGILYVIGTPIGNLGDITVRAKQILQDVDLILAEDTRHSRKLLDRLGISTPMQSYHDFNEKESTSHVLELLSQGKTAALISDAGTPLICDPGYFLVKTAHEQGIRLIPIPGASAAVTALSVSGMAADRFVFEGFLPEKSTARKRHLQTLVTERKTLIFYEAPHRILELLGDVVEIFGVDRLICICRELTKKFETIYRGSAGEILDLIRNAPRQQKGEFVVIIKGNDNKLLMDGNELSRITSILLKHGLSIKNTSAIAADITGARKNELYNLALKLGNNPGDQS